jgi:predicted phosphodiesterase
MKIHVLSDLHLEFSNLPPPSAHSDVVVLAGDIWKKDHGIHWARSTWPDSEIIYVAGNHEFYGSERNSVLDKLRSAAKDNAIHFLENDEIIINNTRFLGCTLWTDFMLYGAERADISIQAGQYNLNDFRLIKEGNDLFTPLDSIQLFQESVSWLKNKLTSDDKQKTVVITHHLPSSTSISEKYANEPLNPCFASNLDYLFGIPNIWIHGHTHDSFDYFERNTRVVCNPRGYVQYGQPENKKFNPEFIIEI